MCALCDQRLRSVASDLGLQCFLYPIKMTLGLYGLSTRNKNNDMNEGKKLIL